MRQLLVGSVALLALAACTSPQEPEPGPADVVVELDAFSGVPNPSWTLSAREAGELASRLRDLPPAAGIELWEPVLGYRGFWIRNPGGEGGIPESVYVSRAGFVRVGYPEETDRVFRDERDAEAWLRAEARQQGYESVFEP